MDSFSPSQLKVVVQSLCRIHKLVRSDVQSKEKNQINDVGIVKKLQDAFPSLTISERHDIYQALDIVSESLSEGIKKNIATAYLNQANLDFFFNKKPFNYKNGEIIGAHFHAAETILGDSYFFDSHAEEDEDFYEDLKEHYERLKKDLEI